MKLRDAAGLPQTLLRTYGLRGLSRRVRYEVKLRSGWMRRGSPGLEATQPTGATPSRLGEANLVAVRAAYQRLPDADAVSGQVVADAERILSGELRFFGGRWRGVGWPPAWRRHPTTGYAYPADAHWTTVSDHDLAAGDIKDVWEGSRFGWAFTFVRAFAVTNDDRYPEAFWNALSDWVVHNPVNRGPNWRCGQESSIRAVSVLFALRAFGAHPSATPQRLATAHRLLRATGRRVAATIHYAASQRNNHAVSEATCLWVLGLSFPGWKEAGRWRRVGHRHLLAAVADQFYADGSYAQHSFTYQRLAMQTLCWALAVARWTGAERPSELHAAVRSSVRLLHAVSDERSGYLPNLGANDGAMLLPLSTRDYRDFRPALQAASMLLGDGRLYGPGPWDEESIWFTDGKLPAASAGGTRSTHRPTRLVAPEGGVLVSRGPDSMALVRVSPSWQHRPSQADDLHVDVWLRAQEVAGDPGTYRYTSPPPWDNGLGASRVHNTVTIDDGNRMRRLGRFLWSQWPRSRILLDVHGADWQTWVVESRVPVWNAVGGAHRRLLARRGDCYVVADLVRAEPPHRPQLHWCLPPDGTPAVREGTWEIDGDDWALSVHGPAGSGFADVVGGPGPQGWRSPTYGVRAPARTLTVTAPPGAAALVTVLGPAAFTGDLQRLLQLSQTTLARLDKRDLHDLVGLVGASCD